MRLSCLKTILPPNKVNSNQATYTQQTPYHYISSYYRHITMKAFIAIPSAAIAVVLLGAYTTDAQLSNTRNDTPIRRRRNVVIGEKINDEFGRQSTPMEKQKHRQMERGGDRTRTGGGDLRAPPDQSMPIVQTEISMPVEPEKTEEEGACEILTKKKCKVDESCTWDGTSCFAASAGEVIESFLEVPVDDEEEAEEVVVVGDACAEHPSYRKCKKDSNCSWNGSVCHANGVVVESIETETPTWSPTSPFPSWFPTEAPIDEVIDWGSLSMSIGLFEAQVEETPIPTYFPTYVPTSDDMSMAMSEFGERFLEEGDEQITEEVIDDPTPTYFPSSWYPTYVPSSDMSMAMSELGERLLEVLAPEEEDMSLPEVTIGVSFLEVGDECTALIKKGQCKKNEACAWDADKLKCKPLDVSTLVEASVEIDFEETTEGDEEVVCGDLRKGLCRNYDACTWDRQKLKCVVAVDEEIAAVIEITEVEEVTSVVCTDLRKGKCKNNDACEWDFNKLKCMSKPPAVQVEEIQDEESGPPTNSPTNPAITPFPTTAALEEVGNIDPQECASYGKKRCEKKDACIWDSTIEVCQSISSLVEETAEPTPTPSTSPVTSAPTTNPVTAEPTPTPTPSPSASPVTSNPTSSPRDMILSVPESVVAEDVEIVCEGLRRKMCQQEDECEWDGKNNVCHTLSAVAPEETDQTVIEMSMPVSIDPIVCEELTTIRLCKKNMPKCTYWYNEDQFVCHEAPPRRLLRGGPTISRRQYYRQMMSMPEIEMMSIPEKIVEDDPCAELSKKQCKKNADTCTWGEDDTCFTTPV